MNIKQKKIKIEPRIKLNHSIDNIWGPHSVNCSALTLITANYPGSILVTGIRTPRVFTRFAMTGEGRIISSYPRCPLLPGLLGICHNVRPWEPLLSLSGSPHHFGRPMLFGLHSPFHSCVEDSIIFTNVSGIFVRGSIDSIFDGPKFKFHVRAARLSAC